MAATAAVLDTCELLEHIISFLPARNIGRVQRVPMTWQELIRTSKVIQRVRVLRPCNEANCFWDPSRWEYVEPTYTTDTSLIFHPAVASSLDGPCNKNGVCQNLLMFDIPPRDSERHDHNRDMMLTTPPISRALVFSPCGFGHCEVYSPKGLKLRDALEVAQAVASLCPYNSECSCKKRSVHVQVSVVGAKPIIKAIKW